MIFGVLRLIGVLWILGFIVLALAATSSFLFTPVDSIDRGRRWSGRLTIALLWPIALMTPAGRARLRRGF